MDPKYADYDAIVDNLQTITPELIRELKEKRVSHMISVERARQKAEGVKIHQIKVEEIDPESILDQDIVFRLMTNEHIPLEEGKETIPKLNFHPFKHYVIENGSPREVGRSHWKGTLEDGRFSQDHGNITNRLAKMYMLLVERYSQKPNWRGYSYLDEMKGQALIQLIQAGLKFDESKSQNPFAYYTTTMTNSFTGVFHKEKRNQIIRDDILSMQGLTPSNTRMVENEMEHKFK